MVVIPEKQQDGIQLSSLDWISGNWSKKTDNATMEEYWYPIMGDAMAGWFRWKKGNSIFLYEFMLFQQVENNVVLKIKHFDYNLVGWEEKEAWVEYQAWNSSPNKIFLRAADPKHTPWLIYEQQDSNLIVTFYDLQGRQKDQYDFYPASV